MVITILHMILRVPGQRQLDKLPDVPKVGPLHCTSSAMVRSDEPLCTNPPVINTLGFILFLKSWMKNAGDCALVCESETFRARMGQASAIR